MTITTSTARIAAGALAFALSACGASDKTDPYLDAIPDAAALTIDAQAAAPAAAAIDPAPVSSLQNDLAVVHEKAEAMNAALRDVFARLEELTATGGREMPNGVKMWGPAIRCVQKDGAGACVANGEASLRLIVRRYTDHAADFAVQARDAASVDEGDFKAVLAGYLIRGEVARRGAGKLWVNFQNLKGAAPGFLGQGYLAAGFAAGPVAKAVTYRMLTFTRDPALHAPVTAAFAAWKNAAGLVRARVADFADLDKSGAALELGFWRAVWAPLAGGRAFTVVTDWNDRGTPTGDVPAGKYWFARACYAPGQTAPEYKEWFLCDRLASGLPNPPVACVVANAGAGAKEPGVGSDAITTWQETSCFWDPAQHGGSPEPEGLRPPGMAPLDHADDDRDEDGEANVGLMPEPCPTTVSTMSPDTRPPGMM